MSTSPFGRPVRGVSANRVGNKPELIWEHTRQSLAKGRHSRIFQLTTKMENPWGVVSDKDESGGAAEMNRNICTQAG